MPTFGNWSIKRRTLAAALSAAWMVSGCMYVSGMEFVQAVQTPNNGVPMVALKPTFVRVFVRASEAWHGPWNLDARLVIQEASGAQHEIAPMNPTPIVAPQDVTRTEWTRSFTFALDRVDTYPGTRSFTVRVFEVGTASPRTETYSTPWTFDPPVYDHAYGVVWAVTNNNDGQGAPLGPAAPWSDFAGHVATASNVAPVSGFSIMPLPGVGYKAPDPQTFGNLVDSRAWGTQMLANLPANSKINLLDNWDTGGMHGWSDGRRSEEQNERTHGRMGVTMSHEIAHGNGLWCHTFDTCSAYPSYPHASGYVDVQDVGINVSGNKGVVAPLLATYRGQYNSSGIAIDGGPTGDLMSYVMPTWISSFTYCIYIKILWKENIPCSYVYTPEAATPPSDPYEFRFERLVPKPDPVPEPPGPVEMAFVSGVVDAGGAAEFRSFERLVRAPEHALERQAASDLVVNVIAVDGAVLGSTPLTPRSGDLTRKTAVSALLPAGLLSERAAKLQLARGKSVLAERSLDRSVPRVQLEQKTGRELAGRITLKWSATAADTRELRYTLLFSTDNGSTWWPLNVALSESRYEVNTESLPGTDRAWFKVRASNFGQSTESAPIGPFHIAPKPPRVVIEAPLENSELDSVQQFVVRASAHSWQQGAITETDAFRWELDGQPLDSNGPWWVARNLGAGEHVLKVVVQDRSGLSGEAKLRFVVKAAKSASGKQPAKK